MLFTQSTQRDGIGELRSSFSWKHVEQRNSSGRRGRGGTSASAGHVLDPHAHGTAPQ
jgi:hypothetical protein